MRSTRFFLLISFLISFLLLPDSSLGQLESNEGWKIKRQEGKLIVYTREHKDSPIKEVRITTNVRTTMDILLSVVGDVRGYEDWVYKCAESKKIKTIGDNDYFYYNHSDVPFPASDRDLVVHSRQRLDPKTGIFYSNSIGVPDMIPKKKGIVRVKQFQSSWIITPLPDGTINIDTRAMTDPGGNIPTWIVNLTLAVGPLKTIRNLSNIVEKKFQESQ